MADGVGPVDLDLLADRVRFTCARVGVDRATVGLMVIGPDEMARINGEHRDKPTPTDVLSFPVDGPEALDWPDDGPPLRLATKPRERVISAATTARPAVTGPLTGRLRRTCGARDTATPEPR
ncbi:MAG: hypothetical protein EBU54_11370 [Mycobacteriaceae bacterium]|nr:hypothetical protein [Mycobacteriaceae bacterium]